MGTLQAFMGTWSPAMSLAQTVPRNVILPHMPVGYARHDATLRGLASLLCSVMWISELAFLSLDRSRVTPYGYALHKGTMAKGKMGELKSSFRAKACALGCIS